MPHNVISEFDILENENGDMLLVIDSRDNEPEEPSLIINKGQVTLMRNGDDAPVLSAMTDNLIESFQKKGRILVVETDADGIIREYMTPVILTE